MKLKAILITGTVLITTWLAASYSSASYSARVDFASELSQ